ncbi:hypothetical protein OG432_24320 [Streptomyces sp. NBC_00442]|uniref:hypothetical protein n=1 Tax=Streptomyces sp. NBC_00442 TaxID=2903651 RepID=UPI002E1BDFA7
MNTLLADIAVCIALSIAGAAQAGWITAFRSYAAVTVTLSLVCTERALSGETAWAAITAAVTVYFSWQWWKSGGRHAARRLRSVLRRRSGSDAT